jgi:hypothetical protein
MSAKLSKYYEKISVPFVYSDAMLLDPSVKLELFQLWSKEGDRDWAEEYSDKCRTRFMDHYNSPSEVNNPSRMSLKRKRPSNNDDDDYDDYESMRSSLA